VLHLELLVLRIPSVGALVLRNRAFSTRLGTSLLGLSSSALCRLLGSIALALGRGRSRGRRGTFIVQLASPSPQTTDAVAEGRDGDSYRIGLA
jgi:hypothetical protein